MVCFFKGGSVSGIAIFAAVADVASGDDDAKVARARDAGAVELELDR